MCPIIHDVSVSPYANQEYQLRYQVGYPHYLVEGKNLCRSRTLFVVVYQTKKELNRGRQRWGRGKGKEKGKEKTSTKITVQKSQNTYTCKKSATKEKWGRYSKWTAKNLKCFSNKHYSIFTSLWEKKKCVSLQNQFCVTTHHHNTH